jgi:hypothetical protein
MIPIPMNAQEILDREFLQVRSKLLEVAASLDRMERAEGDVRNDLRLQQLRSALGLMASGEGDYAEQFQMLFSLPYNENWREQYGVTVS